MRLLLISSSTVSGGGYLDEYVAAIASILAPPVSRVLFVPDAVADRDRYTAAARTRFEAMGFGLESIHEARHGAGAAVAGAEAIFIGGGNTFRLLDRLSRSGLLEPIRRRVLAGMPYIGSSAGSNVACPTIGTTNDMPIVEPPSFAALGLVPFNINPHYHDPMPGSMHMGETREQRIAEFHEENHQAVVGLREGAWLDVDGTTIVLQGGTGARLFRRDQPPVEYQRGSRLDFLMRAP